MLYRVFGRAGSGKTEYMIGCLRERLENGENCVFIVPEQQTVKTELLIESSGASGLFCEVLNFERLPDFVKRSEGGLALNFIDGGGKSVLMKLCLDRLAPSLSEYGKGGVSIVRELIATINALKAHSVTPDGLTALTERVRSSGNMRLYSKLSDLCLIYEEYQKGLDEGFSDSGDELTRLAALLRESGENGFFSQKNVFIDGCYTYTEQEYAVIREIVASAKDIFISFVYDEDEEEVGSFDENAACAKKILSFAHGKSRDVFFTENFRTGDEALRYAERFVWHTERQPYAKKAESVSLVKCDSRFDEAESAAAEIYKLLEKGFKFKDIAVIFRSPASYDGIIDAVFDKYGIPFHFSVKDSIAVKPLAAFVTGLLDIAASDFSFASVKKYLKSSFSVLSDEETDLILRYAYSWRLRGGSWRSEADWLMNPDGYRENLSAEAERTLIAVNKARRKLLSSIMPTVEVLRGKELTIDEGARALYRHLIENETDKRLIETAEKLKAAGEEDEAARLVQLWDVFVNIFNQLYLLGGSSRSSAKELKELIEIMLEEYKIGSIPTLPDAVAIGDAKLFRGGGLKAFLILGLNDGEFPAMPVSSGLFTINDGICLEREGLSLIRESNRVFNEERFLFYIAVSSPTDYLYLSYIEGGKEERRPSPAFNDIAELFPLNEIRAFGKDERDRLFCKRAAYDYLPFIKSLALKERVKEELEKDEKYLKLLRTPKPPLLEKEAYIEERKASVLVLSSSKIDCYNNCAFSYLLNYVLKLKDNRVNSFSSLDTGSFLHKVLEEYMKKRTENGGFSAASPEETALEIDAFSDIYIKSIMKSPPAKRVFLLIERLKNMLRFVCRSLNDEFLNSRFVPTGFEVKIGRGGEIPSKVYSTEKGRLLTTVGKIDRIDEYTENGKRYIRVVDYKSSPKSFSAERVREGENIQLLSYLFTCLDCDESAVPAAVLYRPLVLPRDGSAPQKSLRQSGAVIADPDIIAKMDGSAGNSFLPVTLTQGGELNKTSAASAISEEGFAELKSAVREHICGVVDKISDGEMSVKPFRKKETSCALCPYGEVCRQKKREKRFS